MRLRLEVNGHFVCHYLIDFRAVEAATGRTVLYEVKGYPTPEWKRKWELTRALLGAGQIPGIPADARLFLVREGRKRTGPAWLFDDATLIPEAGE